MRRGGKGGGGKGREGLARSGTSEDLISVAIVGTPRCWPGREEQYASRRAHCCPPNRTERGENTDKNTSFSFFFFLISTVKIPAVNLIFYRGNFSIALIIVKDRCGSDANYSLLKKICMKHEREDRTNSPIHLIIHVNAWENVADS